jgi:DNA-binding transcriptional LysR family regulator
LFDRNHRSVSPTPAGKYFANEARAMLKHMDSMEANVVRIAKGWRPSLTIAVDVILSLDHLNQLINDFSQEFDDVELRVRVEIFNGVWDALITGRADIAIGATAAMPVDGQFDYKEMGSIHWVFVIGKTHPLAESSAGTNALDLSPYPSICLEDTSREIPRRTTWLLPDQRKLVVPNWEMALDAAKSGAGVGYFPRHVASCAILDGSLIEKCLSEPKAPSPCCLAWNIDGQSPALTWVLEYLGDAEHLQRRWIA